MLLEILIRSQNEDFTEGKLVSKVKEKLKLQKIQVKEEEVFEAIKMITTTVKKQVRLKWQLIFNFKKKCWKTTFENNWKNATLTSSASETST